MFKKFLRWLPIGIAITLLTGLIYVAVQQDIRQSANDPQIQMAEDGAQVLAKGGVLSSVVSQVSTDVSQSLAPFVIVYGPDGKPLASSAQLNGATPVPPLGIFDYAKTHGEDRFTWQPQKGVRIAAVVTYVAGSDAQGFVLAGRSLKEVEKREMMLTYDLLIGWLITLIVSYVAVVLLAKTHKE